MMFDNDHPSTIIEEDQPPETPFHLTKQQSISEIAPETQRSHNGREFNGNHLKSSLENIYGLMMLQNREDGDGDATTTLRQYDGYGDTRIPTCWVSGMGYVQPLQQSARTYYDNTDAQNNQNNQDTQQLTARINPVAMTNMTTDFYNEQEEEEEAHRFNEDEEYAVDIHQRDEQQQLFQEEYMQLMRQHSMGGQEDSPMVESQMIVWGRNQMGQLGIDPQQQSVIKTPVNLKTAQLFGPKANILQIACGKAHTVIIVEQYCRQRLFAFGSNKCGQLGIGKKVSMVKEPCIVEGDLIEQNIIRVACAKNSTFALTQTCELFTWGSHKEGILGLGKATQIDQYSPVKIQLKGDNKSQVVNISAGKQHAGAVIKRPNGEQQLYMWGSNKYGQLGLGDQETRYEMTEAFINQCGNNGNESSDTLTVSIKDQQPINLVCGNIFTIVQTQNGLLFTCGSNIQGQLGLGTQTNRVLRLTEIPLKLRVNEIEKLVASDFAACLLKSGELYMWGPTPLGQLSQPETLNNILRRHGNDPITIQDISIGTSFGLVQDSRDQCCQIGSLFHENTHKHYDSSATSSSQQILNFHPFLAVSALSTFTCGHDFVIASTSGNQQYSNNYQHKDHTAQSMARFSQSRKSANTSRSANGCMARRPQIEENISRYGGGQSAGSYLSPMRQSSSNFKDAYAVILSSQRRNDVMNRSAIIGVQNNQTLKGPNNINESQMNPSQLKQIRDACTPVREFEPPQCGNTVSQKPQKSEVLATAEESFTDPSRPLQNQQHNQLAPHYNTLQDDRMLDHSNNKYASAQLLKTPQNNCGGSKGAPPSQQPYLLNQSISGFSQRFMHGTQMMQYEPSLLYEQQQFAAAAAMDILIREKQELQHSLSIEIQKRLLSERELEQAYKQIQHLQQLQQMPLAVNDQVLQRSQNDNHKLKQMNEELSNQLKELETTLAEKNEEIESLTQKLEAAMQELEAAKSQAVQSDTNKQREIEEAISKRTKEVYDMTVQFGCLKEENHQLKKDFEDLKADYEERLQAQRERAEVDYKQLVEEYQSFQEKFALDASTLQKDLDTIDGFKKTNEEQAEKIKKLEDKVKKLKQQSLSQSRLGARKKSTAHQTRESQDQHLMVVTSSLALSRDPLGSHYTSTGDQQKHNAASQEQSFQSNKQQVVHKSTKVTRKSNVEKENVETTLKVIEPVTVFNPIETPNSQNEKPVVIPERKKPQSANLFRKQQQREQPTLLQSINNGHQEVNTRQCSNREQGCLQLMPRTINKKQSTLVSSTLQPPQIQSQSSAQVKNVLKNNTSKINQTISVTVRDKSKENNNSKTPTRNSRLDTQSHSYLQASRLNNPIKSSASVLTKTPTTLTANVSHQTSVQQPVRRSQQNVHHLKQKSISIPPSATTSNQAGVITSSQVFSINDDDSSIFDAKPLKPEQQPPLADLTLGGESTPHLYLDTKPSPRTPQMAKEDAAPIVVRQSYENKVRDSSAELIAQRKHNLQGPAVQDNVEKLQLNKNASASSTSTYTASAVIMSEMRSKLIDIQNNKQYIEQKIQEYERKLQQLKGTTNQLAPSSNYYYDLPKSSSSNTMLGKSNSSMLLLNAAKSARLNQ